MGYLVYAYYSIYSTRYYKDDSCWSADLKSKTTKDIISIRSFVEVLVLNHYVLVRKILTAKFEAYFEKLEKTKVVLERQLARKVDDSKAEKDQFLKEINHLRTQLENLKGKSVQTKFDKLSILGKPPADKLSNLKIMVYSQS
ncbi:hypothetical protein Tco_0631213 [Tanacetum coccineum]